MAQAALAQGMQDPKAALAQGINGVLGQGPQADLAKQALSGQLDPQQALETWVLILKWQQWE